MSSEPLPLWQMLKEEYESFHGALDAKYVENVAAIVAAMQNPNPVNDWLSAYVKVKPHPFASDKQHRRRRPRPTLARRPPR